MTPLCSRCSPLEGDPETLVSVYRGYRQRIDKDSHRIVGEVKNGEGGAPERAAKVIATLYDESRQGGGVIIRMPYDKRLLPESPLN